MISKTNIYPIGIGTWKIDYENFNNTVKNVYNYLSK